MLYLPFEMLYVQSENAFMFLEMLYVQSKNAFVFFEMVCVCFVKLYQFSFWVFVALICHRKKYIQANRRRMFQSSIIRESLD